MYNNHYLEVFVAFLLAQSLMASIMVYTYQKKKSIGYIDALLTYFKAEVGFFVIGVIGISTILFILSDFIDLSITRHDLLSIENLTWKQNLQLYFKTSSVCLGAFVQYLAFKLKDKGKAAIDKVVDNIISDKLNAKETPDNEPKQ